MMAEKKVPEHFARIREQHGKFFHAMEVLGKTAREAGPIDGKTSHLVQLAAAAAIRSEGAVHSHVRRAVEQGATPEEVHHALLLLTSTIGFPTVAAALSWADDVLQK
jgi:alkylhydroperoxidase/carboxymuconolactone decarboxylase family protein YurZ